MEINLKEKNCHKQEEGVESYGRPGPKGTRHEENDHNVTKISAAVVAVVVILTTASNTRTQESSYCLCVRVLKSFLQRVTEKREKN